MKNSIWDVLTGVILFVILLVIVGFGVVVMNPNLLGLNGGGMAAPVELVCPPKPRPRSRFHRPGRQPPSPPAR